MTASSAWVERVLDDVGELGVAALLLAETVVPPLPSEAVLGLAGAGIAAGRLNGPLVWVAATAGSLAGAWLLYLVGALVGAERLHDLAGRRWFVLCSRQDLLRGERVFARHGGTIVLVGRLVPLVRSAVSVPAGVERMPLGRFTALTVLGSGAWNAALLSAGYALGSRWSLVEQYLKPVSYVVAVALALGLAVLAVRRSRSEPSATPRPAGTRDR